MKKQDIDLNELKQLWETTDLNITEISVKLNTSYDVIRNRINKNNFIRPQHLIDSCEQKRRNKIKKCENRHNNKDIKQEYSCYYCNNKFLPTNNQYVNIKQGKPIFCSVKCRNNYISSKNIIERPKLTCYICGREVECTQDRFIRYRQGEDKFFCSKSCLMKYSLHNTDINKRNDKIKQLFSNEQFKNKVLLKTKKTNVNKYGVDNFAKTKQFKTNQTFIWNNKTPEQIRQIQRLKSMNRKDNIASDGTCFDSSYELDVYEFCKRNNIPIDIQIPIEYMYKDKKHTTIIDFKIDGILFECKGGHLMDGLFSDKLEVPIQQKIEIYRQNHVVIITDTDGSKYIPHKESIESNGLKYLNKCKYPLIGVDIDLFRNPQIPYDESKPECFYKVKVDNKPSVFEAWTNEQLRWKMIKNRINYVGGFINNKEILTAMNVTRTCKQPSWFSKQYAKTLIKKYITTDIVLDPFAGWGTRCDACKELGKYYYGWDLNRELVEWHESKGRLFDNGCGIEYGDANNIKTDRSECSVFICPPYTDFEKYFDSQDIKTTQCEWLSIVMNNIPNAKEYVMVCKIVDPGFEKFIVEEKVNKSHFGTNKEYVILIKNNKNLI